MIDTCFKQLDKTNSTSEYIIIYNFIFEIFVKEYRDQNNIGPDKVISIFKAFRGLGATKIDPNFDGTLEIFKDTRNELIHQIEDIGEKIEEALSMQDEFRTFMLQYETLLGGKDFTYELEEILVPMDNYRSLVIEEDLVEDPIENLEIQTLGWE